MTSYPFLTQLNPTLFSANDVYAVFGNPIAHSKSPLIHEQFARNSKQHLMYQRIQPSMDGFSKMLTEFFQMGGKGANVTIPFKVEAFERCDHLSGRARLAAAVNTVWQENGHLYGDNTDGIGLFRDLVAQGVGIQDQSILILGAGGASRGILEPFLRASAQKIVIANRTAQKAHELVLSFKPLASQLGVELASCSSADLEKETYPLFDVVINASAAGLNNQSPLSPMAARRIFQCKTFAYDLVYGKTTVFMQQALQQGCRVSDGLGMLVEQAAEAFIQWRKLDLRSLDTRGVLAGLRLK